MLAPPASKLQFEIVLDIAADAAQAFAAMVSEAGMRAWIPLCRSARWQHPPGQKAIGVASVRHILVAGGIVAAERIVAWEEGSELHYVFDKTSLPLAQLTRGYVGVMRIESADDGRSRLYWAVHFDPAPGPLASRAAPIMRATLRPFIALMARGLVRAAQGGRA